MVRKSFPLRIDAAIHQSLEAWAADELRSVNGHIEYLLRQALKQAGRLPRAEAHSKRAQAEETAGEEQE